MYKGNHFNGAFGIVVCTDNTNSSIVIYINLIVHRKRVTVKYFKYVMDIV
jgi:hypothetical protein